MYRESLFNIIIANQNPSSLNGQNIPAGSDPTTVYVIKPCTLFPTAVGYIWESHKQDMNCSLPPNKLGTDIEKMLMCMECLGRSDLQMLQPLMALPYEHVGHNPKLN